MVAPIVQIFDQNDNELNASNPNNLGVVNAGASSDEKTIKIVNNKEGGIDVSAMEDITITTVTKNGYNTGDTVENGKEAVEGKWMQIKSITDGDQNFQPVGGTVVKNISDIRGSRIYSPDQPTVTAGHLSGSKVAPGTYYGVVSTVDETGETEPSMEQEVTISPSTGQSVEDSSSESLNTSTSTKIAQKFVAGQTYLNGAFLKMASGGTLVGTLRIETDNVGPSGVLADNNLEKTNITLNADAVKNIFTDAEGALTNSSTYWLVFVVTSGSGALRGTNTGIDVNVKIYQSGAWIDSANVKDLVYGIISDNKISWDWNDVPGAKSYKLFRTTESGNYGVSSLIAAPVDSNFEDTLEIPGAGQPVSEVIVTFEHAHEIKERLDVPTNASGGAVEMALRISYSYI